MKNPETTICPICQQTVSITVRTFTVRKHRLDGHGSAICEGSGRLFLRPHNLESTTSYTLYIDESPIISSSDRQYLSEIEAELELDYVIQAEPIASVATVFELPRSTPDRLNVHWYYLPTWMSMLHSSYLVRSRTSNNLVGLPPASKTTKAKQLQTELNTIKKGVQGNAVMLTEIDNALDILNNGSAPHKPLSVSARVAATIINVISTGMLPQQPMIDAQVKRDLWVLLTHKVIPKNTTYRTWTRLLNLLEQVESALAYNPAHRAHLHDDLIEISHIRDILNVHSMYSC